MDFPKVNDLELNLPIVLTVPKPKKVFKEPKSQRSSLNLGYRQSVTVESPFKERKRLLSRHETLPLIFRYDQNSQDCCSCVIN